MNQTVMRRLTVLAVTMLAMLAFASPAWAGTFTVDTTGDPIPVGGAGACTAAPGDCSLRGAIEGSYNTATLDTIGFDPDIFSGINTDVITLGDALTTGDPTDPITNDLTINGPGRNALTVKQSAQVRVFQIVGKATINGITISGGRSPNSAGGILNNGGARLTLNDTTVTDNQALGTQASTGLGGGIFNASNATLTLNRSTVSANKANTPTGYGGGIYNQTGGNVTLNNSTVNGTNTSSTYGGGLYSGGTLTLNNSTINGVNTASHGGGIFNSFGTLTLDNSTVSANEASSYGGGIFNDGGTLSLNESTISGVNKAVHGGGIYNSSGKLTLNRSTVSTNKATGGSGGGIYNTGGTLTLDNSTVSANQATHGGGISSNTDLAGKTTTVTNSTISGNTASTQGGGIRNSDGRTVIKNSTITNNSAPTFGDGSGVASFGNASTRTEVLSSIISADTNTDVDFVEGTTNSFLSRGFNRIGDGNATAAFNKPSDQSLVMVPGLGPLANNGGPTQTHALQPGSPAIDRATNTNCPATDQRGVLRPQGPTCDIGAFERDRTSPKVTVTSPPSAKKGVARNTNLTATFSEKMMPTTLTKTTFKLYRCPSTTSNNCTAQITNTTVTPSTDGLKATLNPFGTSATLLGANTKYKASVTPGAKDLSGNVLDQNPSATGSQQKIWFFTTGTIAGGG
jgi:hypothetical protein